MPGQTYPPKHFLTNNRNAALILTDQGRFFFRGLCKVGIENGSVANSPKISNRLCPGWARTQTKICGDSFQDAIKMFAFGNSEQDLRTIKGQVQ